MKSQRGQIVTLQIISNTLVVHSKDLRALNDSLLSLGQLACSMGLTEVVIFEGIGRRPMILSRAFFQMMVDNLNSHTYPRA